MGELGQVFTPANVAQLMSELLLENTPINKKARVLDPCIGENIFLEHLAKIETTIRFDGIEIDKRLISSSTTDFFSLTNRNLHLGNFFDVTKSLDNKFDLIIQNPPYVRQEKMTEENDKNKIKAIFEHKNYKIPAKSNLYIYFLLKSIDLLKDNGKMVAIVYDSWLYSAYGESFKQTLASLGSVESVIHFQAEAFTNADVGATILEFTKNKPQTSKVRYAEYENALKVKHLKDVKWSYRPITDLVDDRKTNNSDDRFVSLGTVAEINRGTSAQSNKLFVFKEKSFNETIPFLKSVKDISSMSAKEDRHLLAVENSFAAETSTYLQQIKELILKNNHEYQVLAKRIEKGEVWYTPRLAKPGDIIFNYYLRDSFDFILNSKRLQSSDNFYNLRFKSDVMAYFAMLNSARVKNSVLRSSRRQGSGLRKVQIYEFKNVLVPNLNTFSKTSIEILEKLGKQLSKQLRNSPKKQQIVGQIDAILEKELLSREDSGEIVYSNTEYGTALVR